VTTLSRSTARAAEPAPVSPPKAAPTGGSEGLLATILHLIEDAKAEETVKIDLAGKTSLADAMVVTTGRSNRHVSAIADQVIEELKKQGYHPRVEGQPHCDWVLIDAGDVIVHIFRPEVRSFYNLEKMWGADRPAERAGA
jgi:ribosome-associated protein